VSHNLIVARAARATAKKLAPQYGTRLEAEVEAALFSTGTANPPPQFIDPIGLGSLIVSTAALAYQIYSDRKKQESKPTGRSIAHTIKKQRSVDLTDIDVKIIETVSTKIIEYGDDDGS
jgi:hypothetical protein